MMIISSSFFYAQNLPNSRKTITAEFAFPELEFSEITVTTNVLKVRNNNGKNYTFSVSLNLPAGWKTLNNEDKEYVLKPNDSIYIPVRIITSNKKSKGGTKYSISAYINTNEGKQMAYARFLVGRPKITNWQMQILPRPRIYFLNGENNSSFQINVSNQGDENQEVLVSMQKIGEGLVLMDTTNKIIKKNYFELNLPPYADTTISYNVLVSEAERNQSRIDVWSYRPNTIALEKRYSLFIRGSEVRLESSGAIKKTKKVDFVKLANSIDFVKLNNSTLAGNGSNTIPLTVFTSINNLFGQQPIVNSMFQGVSQVGKFHSINYQFQTSLIYYKFSNDFYSSRLAGNINYNLKRSFIGYNFGNNSKTIMWGYSFKNYFNLSSFWSRQRFLGLSSFNSFGLNVGGRFTPNITFSLGSSISLYKSISRFSRSYFGNINFNFPKLFNLSLFGNYQFLPFGLQQDRFFSSSYGFNFSTAIRKYSFSLGYFYSKFNQTFSGLVVSANRFDNFFMNNNVSLKRGWNINLNTSYNITNSTTLLPNDSTTNFNFNNLILISKPRKSNRKISIIPSFYADITGFLSNRLFNYGAQFNLANNKFQKDYYVGGTVRAGYTSLLNTKGYGAVFNSQANLFIRYKVWNILGLYNYGPFSNIEKLNVLKNSPSTVTQMLRLSFGHQYQFKNKHFVLENNPTYMYLNTLKRNTFSVFSQLFYFTENNLRFAFFVNYNLTSGMAYSYSNVVTTGAPVLTTTEGSKKSVTQGSLIGLNIKKDFAIPIPKRFRNNKFCDSKFIVFLDVNGNNKMEDGEVPVENVVLRMNDFEVITNDKGAASFINISFAKYKLQVFPLMDVGSWFPNVPDSMEVCGPEPIYIPFSKGVQVYGLVELDREEFAGQLFEKLDISRFKIYLVDSTGKTFTSVTDNRGNFNFYVPYAKYILKFDENALGSGFYLPENDIPLDLTTGIESYYHHFLIIEKKRKMKKKIFGPDGKVTYVEEDASSKDKKDKKETFDGNGKDLNTDSLINLNNGLSGKDGKDAAFNIQIKETKLDSLIKLLNDLLKRVATKPDVRAIVKQEIQLLRDELNATFTIQIDEFPKGKRPTGVLLQLIRMKKVDELKLPDGKVVYYSGDYKTVQEAEKFCKDFQSSGFKKAKVANRKTLLNTNK